MRVSRTRPFLLFKNAVKRVLPGDFTWPVPRDDGDEAVGAPPVVMAWPEGVAKPRVGLVRDVDVYPYWTKYRRFLEANGIEYAIYDIHRSNWLEEAEGFDVIVWCPMGFPQEVEECRRKFYVLEEHLGKLCYPSFSEAMLHEDKLLQYYLLRLTGLPVIETFISNDRAETLEHMGRRQYPAVWKLATGSGSLGVELANDARVGRLWARRAFSFAGRRTYWPYLAQKDYVYVQRLEPNMGYDVRVIVIGDKVFGYFRDVPRGEFRASGMDTVRKDPPPPAAIAVARRTAQAIGAPCLAVDMLVGPGDERPLIIEVSMFVQVNTPEQLKKDGIPGMLVGDDLEFVPGRVWPQELALQEMLRSRWLTRDSSTEGLR